MEVRLFQAKKERGVAILLSLGVLSLVLLLAMGYAYSSQGGLQLSAINSDLSRSNLLAEAAVQRCIGFLQDNFDDVAPHHKFVDDDGRFYLVSRNTTSGIDSQAGAAEALSVTYPLGAFLDSTDLDDEPPGWIYVMPRVDLSNDGSAASATMDTIVTGRFTYAIINETGKVDPNYLVDVDGVPSVPADWVAEGHEPARLGDSLAELSLKDILDSETLSHYFQHENNFATARVVGGRMPDATHWLAQAHYFRSISIPTAYEDTVANTLFPWSLDSSGDGFWNDYSGTTADDRIVDTGEIFDKLDITKIGISLSDTDLYNHFVNFSADPTRTDVAKFSPWLRSQEGYSGASELRRIAAHTAVNIADAADSNSIPRVVYLDPASNYAMTDTKPASYEFCLIGEDGQFHVGEVLLSLEMVRPMGSPDVTCTPQVQVGLFNPFRTTFAGSLEVEYEMSAQHLPPKSVFSGTFTISGSSSPSWTHVTNWSFTSSPMRGASTTIPVNTLPVPVVRVTMDLKKVTAKVGTDIVDVMPARDSVLVWEQPATVPAQVGMLAAGTTAYAYRHIRAKNPSFNGWDTNHTPLATSMLELDPWPITPVFATALPTFSATPPATWYTNNAQYGDVSAPRDTPFTRVIQLGRVARGFGYYPPPATVPPTLPRIGGSLRFWSFSSAKMDVRNHDGHLLDMFSEPDAVDRGRININSPYSAVLEELFRGAADTPATAATNVITASQTKALASIGELAGLVGLADDGVTANHEDDIAEANVAKWYRFGSVRYNYFTIVAVAQALQDTGKQSLTTGTQVEWLYDIGPPPETRYAQVRGEQKVLAVVARDNFTNDYKVLRLEHLANE